VAESRIFECKSQVKSCLVFSCQFMSLHVNQHMTGKDRTRQDKTGQSEGEDVDEDKDTVKGKKCPKSVVWLLPAELLLILSENYSIKIRHPCGGWGHS